MALFISPENFTERYETVRKHEFHQVFQALPALKPLYTQWEKDYDAEDLYWVIVDNSWLPWFSIILYVLFIFGYPELVKKYRIPRYQLKTPWATWNFLLTAFSWFGAFRVVPHFFFLLNTVGFDEVICGAPEPLYGDGAVGFWIQLFVISKIAELLDTVFVTLKQKPPIFLHWYHHITVLLFTWFTYSNENPGIIFIAMNYSVHAIMYLYYFLQAIKMWPSWISPTFITVAQILQMVVGVYVAYTYYTIMSSGGACAVDVNLLYACGIMYSTYLYLFVDFAVKRYILKPFGLLKDQGKGKGSAGKRKEE